MMILTAAFISTFYSKLQPKIPDLSRHKHPGNIRRKRRDPIELITTGDIYKLTSELTPGQRQSLFGDIPIVLDTAIPPGELHIISEEQKIIIENIGD